MKTIGQIIEDARIKKRFSFKKLEEMTKIRAIFIKYIEEQNWQALPPFPTILGFVKSLSAELGIDEKMAVAVLKRDYPPKGLSINPQKGTNTGFTWSPKLTFVVGIGIVILVILGYLTFQYLRFISPPSLTIESPTDGQVVQGVSVLVFGSTDPDARIIINNQPVLTDEDGKFSVKIGIVSTTKEIVIEAVSRSGKERTILRKITVQ